MVDPERRAHWNLFEGPADLDDLSCALIAIRDRFPPDQRDAVVADMLEGYRRIGLGEVELRIFRERLSQGN